MNEQIRRPDHESDPAHNVDLGQDWSDEGGATAWGPATHPTVLPTNDSDVGDARDVGDAVVED